MTINKTNNKANLDAGIKGIPVTLIGLNEAGKTSLALRLATGEWIDNTVPTLGINFETYRIGDTRLKLFDLGGHEVLRRQFWINYASNSYGVLFIFDASNQERIKEGKEWFWYLIDNLEIENKIVVAFLANKADLDCMTLEDIIQSLDLQRMSKYPKISFQIFKISVKTNFNVPEAMDWFSKKIQEITIDKLLIPKGLIISNTFGNIKLFLDFSDVTENIDIIITMLSNVLEKEENSLREERIASIVSNYGQIVFQERGEIVISLITEINTSHKNAQRLIDLIFEHLEEKRSSSKDELIKFIIKTFEIPKDEYREVSEISL